MALEIRETAIGGKLNDFLNVVDYVYRGDPNYVRPLDMEMKDRLSLKNPFFEHAEGVDLHRAPQRLVRRAHHRADRSRAPEALQRRLRAASAFWTPSTTPTLAKALLDAASNWLRARGMKTIRGPLSLSLNDEMGCLVDGFDTPPMIMMPHHRAYQGGLDRAGRLHQAEGRLRLALPRGRRAAARAQAHDDIEAMPEVKSRHVDMKNLDADLRIIMDVYNDAWNDNWGFVAQTERELSKMAADLKLIAVPELSYITEIDGEPAAVALALPNLNELIADMKGKLGPLGLPKLVWRLKVVGPHTARLIILGIKKKFRGHRKYAALERVPVLEDERRRQTPGSRRRRAVVDARGQRRREHRHQADGRQDLQDVPDLRKESVGLVRVPCLARTSRDQRPAAVASAQPIDEREHLRPAESAHDQPMLARKVDE